MQMHSSLFIQSPLRSKSKSDNHPRRCCSNQQSFHSDRKNSSTPTSTMRFSITYPKKLQLTFSRSLSKPISTNIDLHSFKAEKPATAKRLSFRAAVYKKSGAFDGMRQIKPSQVPVQAQKNNYKQFPKRETRKNNNPYKSYMFTQRKINSRYSSDYFDNAASADFQPIEKEEDLFAEVRQYARSAQMSRAVGRLRANKIRVHVAQKDNGIEPWSSRLEDAKIEEGF